MLYPEILVPDLNKNITFPKISMFICTQYKNTRGRPIIVTVSLLHIISWG